jgi:hypothetical protein
LPVAIEATANGDVLAIAVQKDQPGGAVRITFNQ